MFAWGKTDAEIEAEQADMVRRGVASAHDTFQVFTWLESTDMPRGPAAKVPQMGRNFSLRGDLADLVRGSRRCFRA
jgi:hypothetical protein